MNSCDVKLFANIHISDNYTTISILIFRGRNTMQEVTIRRTVKAKNHHIHESVSKNTNKILINL